jgi:hypothetical protein
MLTDKQSQLVIQTFYTPMKKDSSHEMMHVVHDVTRGCIYRVYTDNYIVKTSGQQAVLEALPKLGEFTTTTNEFNAVIEDARERGILNQPLGV